MKDQYNDRERSPRRDGDRSPSRERERDGPRRDGGGRGFRRGGYERGNYRPSPPSFGGREYRGSDRRRMDDYEPRRERNYSNSIFVGNIPYSCENRDLRELFDRVGTVVRADVITAGGRHRGMGTVEFASKEDAERAIREYDHTTFMDRDIFVRQDQPPPQSRRNDDRDYRDRRGDDRDYRRDDYGRGGDDSYGRDRYNNDRGPREARPRRERGPSYDVFVGNLPFSVNWQALKDLFREISNDLKADVRTDHNGRSKGFGIVTFSNPDDVQAAIDRFNGFEMEGRRIDVRQGRSNNVPSNDRTESSNRSVNLYENDSQEDLDADKTIPQQQDQQREQQSFKNSEFVDNVEGNGEPSTTIYVDNLPFATQNDDLYDLFNSIGRVTQAEIKFDHSGRPSGQGVVEFEAQESAEISIAKLNNYNYGGRDLHISFAKRP